MGTIQWRRALGNGSVLGMVLAGHLVLFVFVLADRGHVVDVSTATNAVDPAVLLVSWIRSPPAPSTTGRTIATPPVHAWARFVPARPARASSEPISPAATRATDAVDAHEPAAAVDLPQAASTYGDPYIKRALSGEGASHVPAVPGYAEGSRMKGIGLAPPPSIERSLKRIGDFTTCSRIRMKREIPGNGLDLRLAEAYVAMGCTF